MELEKKNSKKRVFYCDQEKLTNTEEIRERYICSGTQLTILTADLQSFYGICSLVSYNGVCCYHQTASCINVSKPKTINK